MAQQKTVSQFFTTKRTRNSSIMLFHHGKQVASIYRDGAKFWVCCCDTNKYEYDLETFADADLWAWQNFC